MTAQSNADTITPPAPTPQPEREKKKSERAAFFIHFKVSHLCRRGNQIPGQQVQSKSGPAAALR